MESDAHKTIRSVRSVTFLVFIGFLAVALVWLFAMSRIEGKRVNLKTRNAFEAALKGADSVRIKKGMFAKEELLFESRDSNVINGLFENIKLAKYGADNFCDCGGDLKFEFYKQGQLTFEFTFHHQFKIRWDGFHKDIKLTKESREFLIRWVLQNVKDKDVIEQFKNPYKGYSSR